MTQKEVKILSRETHSRYVWKHILYLTTSVGWSFYCSATSKCMFHPHTWRWLDGSQSLKTEDPDKMDEVVQDKENEISLDVHDKLLSFFFA